MNNEYSLYHYGIPGMRWGRRKAGMVSDNPRGRFDMRKYTPGGGKLTNTHKLPKNAKVDGPDNKKRQRNPKQRFKEFGQTGLILVRGYMRTKAISYIKDMTTLALVAKGKPNVAKAVSIVGTIGRTAAQVGTLVDIKKVHEPK